MKNNIIIGLSAVLLIAAGCSSNSATQPVVEQVAQEKTGFTMAEVTAANSVEKCWAVVGSSAYDLTSWVSKHPGGGEAIKGICGTDATAVFTKQHGTFQKAIDALATLKAGELAK